MSYFVFRGISSEDLGLIITKPIVRPNWAKATTEVERPGASSNLIIEGNNYSSSELVVSAVISDTSPEKVHDIYSALQGYGILTLSSAPQEYMNAICKPLVPEAVALSMAELHIAFTVMPFAYAVNPTTTAITTTEQTILNAGTVYSEPLFTLSGSGTVSIFVNDAEFKINLTNELADTEIYIDCEAQVAYYISNGEKIAITELTQGDFPLLHTGSNYVSCSGGIVSMTLNVKERWL